MYYTFPERTETNRLRNLIYVLFSTSYITLSRIDLRISLFIQGGWFRFFTRLFFQDICWSRTSFNIYSRAYRISSMSWSKKAESQGIHFHQWLEEFIGVQILCLPICYFDVLWFPIFFEFSVFSWNKLKDGPQVWTDIKDWNIRNKGWVTCTAMFHKHVPLLGLVTEVTIWLKAMLLRALAIQWLFYTLRK